MTTQTSPSGPPGPENKVLVGVDGSENSAPALEWAARQAAATGARLEICTAYEPGYVFTTSEEVDESMRRIVEQAARHAAEIAPGVETACTIHQASPAASLIEMSRGAGLLVIGSRGLGGFAGLLLGSVSQQCSMHAHCPVAIVRSPA